MLIKCKTKSPRVKGITFHPSLHFLLASMHSGEIQLWNYLNSSLVDVFEYHEGPVRGIDFHPLQPLFASGGDDTNVVVWDFKQKKMLFAMSGHNDYVRTVQFHPNYPWIVSSSDDQTVRIWNWQGRSCISVLQGHMHYVMCARFHPSKDLLVSASLDQTARIWDITQLREKNCAIQGVVGQSGSNLLSNVHMISCGNGHSAQSDLGRKTDRVPFTDVTCLYTLVGHEKGVNWAVFHDVLPCAITASDDKTIRVWRFNGPNIWQTNILKGHTNNICSLIMHPNNINYLLSVSEDKSIKVWDTKKWTLAHTFMLEKDRFWIVQSAKDSNYIAAGHDSGLIVFKLFKERPIVTVVGNTLYYVWNDSIYSSNIEKELELSREEAKKSTPEVAEVKEHRCVRHCAAHDDHSHGMTLDDFLGFSTCMHQNSLENQDKSQIRDDLVFPSPSGDFCKKNRTKILLINGVADSESIVKRFMTALLIQTPIPPDVGATGGLIFPFSMHYNHYCADKSVFLVNYNYKGRSFYEIMIRENATNNLSDHRATCHIGEAVSSCFVSRSLVAAINPSGKMTVHNLDGEEASEIGIDMKLDKIFSVCVNIVLVWSSSENAIVLYDVAMRKTLCTAHGTLGKLCDVIVSKSKKLIAAVYRKFVVIFDRDLKKLASVEMQGRVKTAAWHENNALFFATSDRIYYLMVNGDLGVMRSIDKPVYIIRIKDNALYVMQRNHKCYKMEIVSNEFLFKMALYHNKIETAKKLIETGKVHGYAMVSYLIEKGHPSLARMIIRDPQMRFDLALSCGNLDDAYEDAQVLDDVEAWKSLGDAALEQGNCVISEVAFQKAKLFEKLTMLYVITGNTIKLKKMMNICKFRNDIPSTVQHALYLGDMGELANILKENKKSKLAEICEATYAINGKAAEGGRPNTFYMVPPQPVHRATVENVNWPVTPLEAVVREPLCYDDADAGEADIDIVTMEEANQNKPSQVNADIWGTIDEIDSMEYANDSANVTEEAEEQCKIHDSRCRSPLDFISIGETGRALDALERSFGLDDRASLEEILAKAHISSEASHQSQSQYAENWSRILNHEHVAGIMNRGYAHVTAGAFEDAITEFRHALKHWIFLVSAGSRDYIDQCRIYVTAMLLEGERERLAETDTRRSLELAAYFSCCNLLPQHQYLVMRRTMGIMWKAQNYKTAARIVTRLLSQDVSSIEGAEEEMQKAKKIYALCEQKGIETYSLDYDEDDERDLNICTISLVKTQGQPTVQCRFCNAVALEKYVSQICNICRLCKLTR
ncbi:WD domain, G-beta repeat domain containing protein, putative [Babesia bigemina]|uniref:WD domain, G-beta repeat domain containing protein, putative n=1 Tax=Babesia bigemina TaxID=5866 RepID=A0A061D4P6_BABBI|nr:WD domain, G-beta repeat domain containing protein, putative [Babesia bigemina]CDR93919.1 WD domain, G-beta repeat domain containing protein, putative [Babesia bigemina]|eukprot:XP_012766105.1 WD domain, G-beta repeat domain containing protein, putative [Babesia bigemina]